MLYGSFPYQLMSISFLYWHVEKAILRNLYATSSQIWPEVLEGLYVSFAGTVQEKYGLLQKIWSVWTIRTGKSGCQKIGSSSAWGISPLSLHFTEELEHYNMFPIIYVNQQYGVEKIQRTFQMSADRYGQWPSQPAGGQEGITTMGQRCWQLPLWTEYSHNLASNQWYTYAWHRMSRLPPPAACEVGRASASGDCPAFEMAWIELAKAPNLLSVHSTN